MARARNQRIYSADTDFLHRLFEEATYLGRDVVPSFAQGYVTVLALPLTYKKKREAENKLKAARKAARAYEYDENGESYED